MASRSELVLFAKDRMLPALRHRDFRYLWFSQISAHSAAWAAIAARSWLTYDLAENSRSTWVGVVVFAAMIPYVVVPAFAGVLADKMVRKNLLAWALGFQVAVNACLAVLAFADLIQIWHLILVSFAAGTTTAVQVSAAEPLPANLVPRTHLVNAYALVNAIFHATRLLGPGAIAPLMKIVDKGSLDIGWVFTVCAGAYLAALLLVTRIGTRSTGLIESSMGGLQTLLSGFAYAYKNTVILRVIGLVVFHCALTMSFDALLPAISESRLESAGSGVAFMNMMVGLGALLISTAVAPVTAPSVRGRLFLSTGLVSGLSLLALAASPSLPVAMLATVAVGASQAGFVILAAILIQSVVPDEIRGRVSSIYILHAAGVMSFANFAYGSLGDVFEPGWVLGIGGLVYVGVILASATESTTRRMYTAGIAVRATASSA